jgi:ribosomal protein L25 (general stress protein Ctc)
MFRKFSFKRHKKSRVVPAIIYKKSCESILPINIHNNVKYKINYNHDHKNTCLDTEKEISL